MTERCVPYERTSITIERFAGALIRAWRAALGVFPTKAQAGVLWAQYGVETGAGPWCWNWNIGNVKHVAGDGFDFFMLPNTWEMVGGKRQVFQPPSPVTWFRSYHSLEHAMDEHFRFLRGKRYAAAWTGVELGDVGVFARLLKAAGYFTADANAYASAMRPHFDRWMKSSAFEDALLELEAQAERETEPELVDPPSEPTRVIDQPIVRPRVPLGRGED